MKERYHVSGMTCSACSAHVEKAVNKLAGMEKASVNLLTETMEVVYEEGILEAGQIIGAVEKAGYGAELIGDGRRTENRKANDREAHGRRESGTPDRGGLQGKAKEEAKAMRRRLGISIGFLLPLMYVAMYHMYYEWFGIPIPRFVLETMHGNENAMTFAMTQFILLLPILYMNRKFFVVGFKTLAHLSPNMDSLIALGASAAIGYGIFAMYRISYGLGHGDMTLVQQYSHDLYFESAGMILTLITVGKYLESRSKGKTSAAITKLMDLSPKTAILLTEEGQEVEIPTEELMAGDIFLVKPGTLIPVDGIVIEGNSSVDEAAITGESVPVEKHAGEKVVSATMNKAGFLKCRAQRVGEDTTLSQIIRLVEEASASKAPIAQLADKVAGIFVPVVIGIALLTLCVWLLAGAGGEFAISTAIAVLVISCPCALGLATPVAIMVGTGVGAGAGILIKSGEALQRAREVDTVVMDKTGTITAGKLTVMEAGVYVPDMWVNNLVKIAAALEKKSEHPLAEAVVEYAASMKISIPEVKEFQAVFGRGVEGVLAEDIPAALDRKDQGVKAGTRFLVGNLPFMEENGIVVDPMAMQGIHRLADEGMTPLLIAKEGCFLGMIGVSDQIKATSQKAIGKLKEMGIHVVMLTGDNKRTAEAVRKQLEIEEVVAEVLPQDKEKKISALKAAGHKVAMIGDGINDAPALAAADVGMAIGAGTDVAMESADIILMKSDLQDAVTAIRLSRAVIRNIKQNLFWAFFYNAIGIPLAAGLWYPMFEVKLNPMFGAAAMSLSSIFVVGNALRLRGFSRNFGHKEDKRDTADTMELSGGEAVSRVTETKAAKEATRITEGACVTEITMSPERKADMEKVMKIEGMMCAHCTGRVQKALEAVEGVGSVVMNLEEKTALVGLTSEASDEALTAAVTDAGYEVKEIIAK